MNLLQMEYTHYKCKLLLLLFFWIRYLFSLVSSYVLPKRFIINSTNFDLVPCASSVIVGAARSIGSLVSLLNIRR